MPDPVPRSPARHRPTGIYWPAVAAAACVSVLFVVTLVVVVAVNRPAPRGPVVFLPPTELPPPPPVTPTELPPPSSPPEPPALPVPVLPDEPPLPPVVELPPTELPQGPDVVLVPSAPTPLPSEDELVVEGKKPLHVCKRFGTEVDFHRTPTLAAKKAVEADKLLFVLHVSGDFEDSGFT